MPPIGFAHRGAKAHAPENTLEAFRLAVKLGATGLESDVWVTEDGEAVLDHDGVVRQGLRRRSIAELRRDELPAHMPTLGELYDAVGTGFPLSLDVKDPAAAEVVVDVARTAGADAEANLWLCSPDWEVAASWRALSDTASLVDSTRLRRLKATGPERHVATIAEAGIDCLNMHWTDWTAGLVALVHRFDLAAFGWDAQHRRQIDALLSYGVDGVYSDHSDRLADALAGRPPSAEGPGI